MSVLLRPNTGSPRRSDRFRRFAAIATVLVVLGFVLTSCDNSDSDSSKSDQKETSTTVSSGGAQQASVSSDGPVGAVVKYLASQGIKYVGDCADAQPPRDKGKWCSTLVSGDSNGDTATYDLGPVGEKPEKTITVQRKGDARLTPGFQVGVGDGSVGTPQELTREQLENDVFITGNLQLDQAVGIGNGLADLPPGSDAGTGGTGGTGTTPPAVVNPGNADALYPPTGIIVVPDPGVEVGGEVAFSGSGCRTNEPLTVALDGQAVGTITADGSGRFAGSISVPKGTTPGPHLITTRGADCVLNATITVGGALAFTGSSSHTSTYVLAGIAAVVIGFVLVVATRRRRAGVGGRRPPPTGVA